MKKKYVLLAVAVLGGALSCHAQEKINVGDVVFEKTFDKNYNNWLPRRESWAEIVPDGRGGGCVEITAGGVGGAGAVGNRDVFGNVEKSKSSTFVMTAGIAEILQNYKGCELEVEVGVKGEDIPRAASTWKGVRMAVNYATPTGPYTHSFYNTLSGTFDWKNMSFRIRIPSDMKNMSMSLGLISESGKVSFDHVKMTVLDIPLTMKTPPPGAPYKGHELPRLRGFVTGIKQPASESGIRTLNEIAEQWNANVAKLWFNLHGNLDQVDDALDAWMNSVDVALDEAKRDNIYLILHITSGWKSSEHGGNHLFYEEPEYAEKFVETWRAIAERFKGRKEIYAFELLNESPLRMPIADGCPDYPELMEQAAKAINDVDPGRAIIVQPEEWWGTRAFYKLRPINAKNIIYAVHFYSPYLVSHQGVGAFLAGKTSWMSFAYPEQLMA